MARNEVAPARCFISRTVRLGRRPILRSPSRLARPSDEFLPAINFSLEKKRYGDLPSHTARRLNVNRISAERPAISSIH